MIVDTRPAVKPAVDSMVAGRRPWRFVVVMSSQDISSDYAETRVGRCAEIENHIEAGADAIASHTW